MYDLSYVGANTMQVEKDSEVIFLGQGNEAIRFMIDELGFCKKEIFIALEVCLEQGNDSMHFGITYGFIFSQTKGA